MKRIVMLGPPGAGKGTQALRLCEHLHVPHISTGDIFRHNIQNKTPLGKQAQAYISAGNLVPDELTVKLVDDRLHQSLAEDGFILDGFPRTVEQADALETILDSLDTHLDATINIKVGEEEIIERLLHRAQLEGRADDTRDVIAHRIDVYHASTEPLLKYYEKRSLLHTIDGCGDVDEVWSRIEACLSMEA